MPPLAPDHVIVLAAGFGLRLRSLTTDRPKALVEVGGRTLLEHSLDFAATLRPREILVVAGFRLDLVEAHLDRLAIPGVRLVENPAPASGNLGSVEAALPHVGGSFLLTNCDHVFPAEAAGRIAAGAGSGVTAFCEFERALEADEMKVTLDGSGAIVRIAKSLSEFDGGYIGLTHVAAGALPDYRRAVAVARERHGDAAVAEHVLQALADGGHRVHAATFDGIAWSEVDTPADLARAEARHFAAADRRTSVSPGAVRPGTPAIRAFAADD